jgi:hypothetical protein
MNLARTLTKWLAPAAALFALACALLAPVEAGSPRRALHRALAQNTRVQTVGDKQDEIPDDSTVRGRVVYDDTTRPVRRARVMLLVESGGNGRNEYAALTDSRGDFQIRGVRAGTYYAFVDVPGVLSPVGFISIDEIRAAVGAPDLGEGRKYFDLVEVDGKQDLTVTVHARRGASIAGRVSYADGDPAVNVTISLMRRGADGRVQKYLTGATIVSLSGLRTDDRGMFRLTGLPPGEYLVGVNESVNHGAESSNAGSMGEDISGIFRGMFTQQLLTIYYPSTANVKEAGVIKVAAGDERADVDITIPERDLRLIAGVVRARRGGQPVVRARVSITRRDDPLAPAGPVPAYFEGAEYGPNSTMTDDEGRWQLREIPDGAYVINVKPPEEYETAPAVAVDTSDTNTNVAVVTNRNSSGYSSPRRKRAYAPTRRNLDVSGGDVSEFVVEVADGARIAGTVSIEDGSMPRYGSVAVMRLGEGSMAVADDVTTASGSLDSGRFIVEGLPAGKFTLHPNVGGDNGVYLKSMTWNGKDLLREPLELTEGASAEGVRIVFARNPATLSVTVRGAAGKRPANDFIAYLVPADLSNWSPNTRPLFCAADDGRGTCPITAPPGEYRVLALRRTAMLGDYEQEVRRRAPTAPRVTLREGETSRVEVDAPDN